MVNMKDFSREKKNDDLQGYAKGSKTQTALRPEKVKHSQCRERKKERKGQNTRK